MRRSAIPIVVVALATAIGCGHANHQTTSTAAKREFVSKQDSLLDASSSMAGMSGMGMGMPGGMVAGIGGAPSAVASPLFTAEPVSAGRKIIYEATLRLVVKDFASAENAIHQLAKSHEGFVADSDVDASQSRARAGEWIVRVPVTSYGAFIEAILSLGVPEKRSQNAQDVSKQYIDLESRIANKKKLEVRLLQLLAEHSGQLKDIIDVERELARVREEIERMEGQLRFLSSRVALTTVTIHAREERDYQPPSAPNFAERLRTAWSTSLDELEASGANISVAIVYYLPWLILIAALLTLLIVFIWTARKMLRCRA